MIDAATGTSQVAVGADDSPSGMVRAVSAIIGEASGGSLAAAQELLDRHDPEADRAAVRMIAVWLMSNPQAADALRRHRIG